MPNNTVQYIINVTGNAEKVINAIQQTALTATTTVNTFSESLSKIRDAGLAFDAIESAADRTAKKLGGIFTTGMENELQKQNLTTLLGGDIDAADTIFGKISEYGKNTVYDKAGLIEAQKTMMSFGISAEDAFSHLKQIGDIAMGDKQKMQSLALAFSQASSAGKLGGQDLMQMINAGFNPLQVISEKTGKSMATLKDEMAKGKITTDDMAQAFRWATEEGGMFYQGAEKAGQTLQGRFNQLKDNLTELVLKIYDILQPYAEKAIELARKIITWIGKIINKWKGFVPVVTGVGIALGAFIVVTKLASATMSIYTGIMTVCKVATLAWSAAQHVLNAAFWASPITWIIALVVALIAAIVIVVKKTEGWGETWGNLMEFFKVTFQGTGAWFRKVWLEIENGFMTNIEEMEIAWSKFASLWDPEAANANLAVIQARRDERVKKLAEAQEEFNELERKQMEIKVWQVKWKKSEDGKEPGIADTMAGLMGSVNDGLGKPGKGSDLDTKLNKSTTATATGGTRNTTVNINLGKMVESINFNGGYEQNEQDMEQRLAAMLSRILGMAEATAG